MAEQTVSGSSTLESDIRAAQEAETPDCGTSDSAKVCSVEDESGCKSELVLKHRLSPDKGSVHKTPANCVYLEEPIGGQIGFDLYTVTCGAQGCAYNLWRGEAIQSPVRGPVQAILSFEKGGTAGPFGLLYRYLRLIYNFASGLIIGIVVLTTIIGGIRMSMAAGNQDTFNKGRDMIVKALVGMVIWFLSSVILYTINPTFFDF